MELFANNVIKDHRRRYLFVKKDQQEGYQIMPGELKKVATYGGKNLYALLAFLIIFGILKQRFIYGILASLIIYVGFIIYFKYFFLKDRNTVKIRDQEYQIFSSLEAHEEYKSQAFIRMIIPILIILVIISILIEPGKNANFIDLNLMKFSIAVLIVYMGQHAIKYFKERKTIKELKKVQ